MTVKPRHTELHEDRRARRWKFSDLITDHVTGALRESSVFSIATKTSILWAYCTYVSATNYETMTGVVALSLLGHELGSRVMNLKTQQTQQEAAK